MSESFLLEGWKPKDIKTAVSSQVVCLSAEALAHVLPQRQNRRPGLKVEEVQANTLYSREEHMGQTGTGKAANKECLNYQGFSSY